MCDILSFELDVVVLLQYIKVQTGGHKKRWLAVSYKVMVEAHLKQDDKCKAHS